MRITSYQPKTTNRGKARMTREQFRRERGYQATIAIVRSMLAAEIISCSDFADIDNHLLDKYQPHLGMLRKAN
jgi:hypothetical protein